MPRNTAAGNKSTSRDENENTNGEDQSNCALKRRGTKRTVEIISPEKNSSQKNEKISKKEGEIKGSPRKSIDKRKRESDELDERLLIKSDENSNHKENIVASNDSVYNSCNGKLKSSCLSDSALLDKDNVCNVNCTSSPKRQKIEKKYYQMVDPSSLPTDPLFSRKLLLNCDSKDIDENHQFSVVSYNILADCHALRNPTKSYPWLNEEQCKILYRHKRLFAEILHYDADILCLQEVSTDYFDKLYSLLTEHGYDGHFKRRYGEHYEEGEATFFKKSRFDLKSYESFGLYELIISELHSTGLDRETIESIKKYLSESSVFLISNFICRNTGLPLVVANTHISWEQLKKPDVQCIEVGMVIKKLINICNGSNNAHVICGDFNAPEDTCVYQFSKDGYLNDKSIEYLQKIENVNLPDNQKQALINLWWNVFYHTSDNLFSTYHELLGDDSFVTQVTSKGELKGVDYIWASQSTLGVLNVVKTPDPALISKGIPNLIFPSDHISVKSSLYFK